MRRIINEDDFSIIDDSSGFLARQLFSNSLDDRHWLVDTHCKDLNVLDFQSFLLIGNEDCPQAILLYKQRHPKYNQKPIYVYLQDIE